jgi:hypothetical protein
MVMTRNAARPRETGSGSRLAGSRVRRLRQSSVVEIVLRTETPEGIAVVLPAVVYAKILEEHAAVADLDLIDRTVRTPDDRRPDARPGRERGSFATSSVSGCLPWLSSARYLRSS